MIPPGWRDDADEIRAHLCLLRGGGTFLSSADAWVLLRWFEAGVTVAEALYALERAADARRKKRARTPLSLVAANRHLGKPFRGAFHRDRPARGQEPVLAPAAWSLPRDLAGPEVDALARALLAVPDAEDAPRLGLAAARTFFDAAWTALGDDGRGALREAARAELGDLLGLVDEAVGLALVEEAARDHLRQRYPALTAASLTELAARR